MEDLNLRLTALEQYVYGGSTAAPAPARSNSIPDRLPSQPKQREIKECASHAATIARYRLLRMGFSDFF